ncbi:D-2-hydroxyacid dehydrogenase [Microbacterium sp. MPKO10]|uniref:D-2-hydroxyacid dehydrogenase n=1 Tax=Microbacterium sp. MPKO10 TaxID=2989818 RepID=UPI0022362076|nr:D-2-hydroxyacid dehydrogenase [Microbacterium sp. MPKO10]MCW4459795.1 D-2-hydroxyacid dehydrogenase [Microbacterium sp. MPKO10]
MTSRREIHRVLATVDFDDEGIEQLRRAFEPASFTHVSKHDTDAVSALLGEADVAVLAGDLGDEVLAAPHLKWVHCDHAGLNDSARQDVFDRGLIVTGSAGRSGGALAQHAFFFALNFVYDIRSTLAKQSAHDWSGGEEFRNRQSLWGQNLTIVGFGHTGKAMAALGRASGMHVTVLTRSDTPKPADVDVLLSTDAGDTVDAAVRDADFVMLATNLTDVSFHMIAAPQLRLMKKTAVIINMSRGAVIDEPALVTALQNGEIAGAGLDVFEREPLPESSPLWDMPNVFITPHATPKLPDKTQRSIDTIVANAERYRRNEPLLNALSPRDLFTKGRS